MSNTIQTNYSTGTYKIPAARKSKQAETPSNSFLDIASQVSADAYLKHLESKYGRVTVESIGKDRGSLEKVGKRMSGNDVVIAPNILQDMASDVRKAVYYEQKIDCFFNTVVPRESAWCAARGLVFEPGGVVIHEDGSVTYICGCSDSPERIAEVNRINAEKAKKKAAQQKLYLEQSAAAAARRRALAERAARKAALEESYFNIGDLLKNRAESAAAGPDISAPSETALFLLGL